MQAIDFTQILSPPVLLSAPKCLKLFI